MTAPGALGRRIEAAVRAVEPAIRSARLAAILAGCATIVPIVRAVRTGREDDARDTDAEGGDRDADQTPPPRARRLASRVLRATVAG